MKTIQSHRHTTTAVWIVGLILTFCASCTNHERNNPFDANGTSWMPATTGTAPSAPTLASPTSGDGSVTVSWGTVGDATSYNLYYRAGSSVDKSNGTKVTGVTSPRQVSGLTNGTQYAFAVSAVNDVGEGSLSAVATATPQSASSGSWTVSGNTLTDPVGNTYTTVTIGTQTWTVENLRTTRFNDGTAIPHVAGTSEWSNLSTPGYCFYNNSTDAAANEKWGALYNWYAVNTGKLAPAGWRAPTDADWAALSVYLGGSGVAGGKMKEAGTTNWSSPNTGATNSSGFSALPGGYRYSDGSFDVQSGYGNWWSSTENVASNAYSRGLFYNNENLDRYDNGKSWGFSLRLVRDR